MRRIVYWLVGSLALVAAASVVAEEPDEAEMARQLLKGVDAMRRLPVDGFHLVEAQGHLLVVSNNGHYAIIGGRVLDLWNRLEIRKASDIDATLRLPLAKMGINPDEFGGITVGKTDSSQTITVFLDPGSPKSTDMLPELQALGKRYKLQVIYVPALPARTPISRALMCDKRAALSYFETGKIPTDLVSSPSCGERELDRARITVHLLGIDVLPYTVTADGTPISGHPKDYMNLVTGKVGGRP